MIKLPFTICAGSLSLETHIDAEYIYRDTEGFVIVSVKEENENDKT